MRSTKKLLDLDFPIYKMGQFEEIYTNDLGLKVIRTAKREWILDDTRTEMVWYASRRIRLKQEGYSLYKLNKKLGSFSQVIQYPSGTYFIDSSGYVFKYKKGNKFYKLRSYPIHKRAYDAAFGTILYGKGLSYPLTYSGIVSSLYKYITVLEIDGGGLLYDITVHPQKATRIKI